MRDAFVVLIAVLLLGVAQAHAADAEALKAQLKRHMQQGAKAEDEVGIVFCSAKELFDDYDANEVAADQKYKGRFVELGGELLSVSKDFTGDPYLVLKADAYGMARVNAELFPAQFKTVNLEEKSFEACTDIEAAGRLRKGQKVLLNCKGLGSTMGFPRLGQCVIVPPEMQQ